MEPERQVMKTPRQNDTRTGNSHMNKETSQMNATQDTLFRKARTAGLGLLAALALLAGIPRTAAQAQPLSDALFTVGTSATDDQGTEWAYLLFQLTASGDALLNRRLAVYAKPGDIGRAEQELRVGLGEVHSARAHLEVKRLEGLHHTAVERLTIVPVRSLVR